MQDEVFSKRDDEEGSPFLTTILDQQCDFGVNVIKRKCDFVVKSVKRKCDFGIEAVQKRLKENGEGDLRSCLSAKYMIRF